MTEKIYYISSYHRGRRTIVKGTLKTLTDYFSYDLMCGKSWNTNINDKPKTFKSLISNLNKSYKETQGRCYDPDSVEASDIEEYNNAEANGYRTSEAKER